MTILGCTPCSGLPVWSQTATILNRGVCITGNDDHVWCSSTKATSAFAAMHLTAETGAICAMGPAPLANVTCWQAGNAPFYSGWPLGSAPGPFATVSAGILGWCGVLRGNGSVSCRWASAAPAATLALVQSLPSPPVGGWQDVCVGSSYACAANSQTIHCWGDLSLGIPGGPIGPLNPHTTVSQLACGNNIMCVVWSNASLSCWPPVMATQIGVPPTGQGQWVSVSSAADIDRVCAIRAHTLEATCWARIYAIGEVSSTPLNPVTGGVVRITQVSATLGLTCAVAIDDTETSGRGRSLCWGTPTLVALASSKPRFISLAVGASHSCGLTAGGSRGDGSPPCECWGEFRALGVPWASLSAPPTTSAFAGPTAVVGANFGEPIVRMAAGSSLTCVVTASTRIGCWGSAASSTTLPALPSSVTAGTGTQVQNMVSGSGFVCVHWAPPNSTVNCWGVLILKPGTPSWSTVTNTTIRFKSITASSYSVCGIVLGTQSAVNGTLRCWGGGIYHEQAAPANGTQWAMVALTTGAGCGIPMSSAQNVYMRCWGDRQPITGNPINVGPTATRLGPVAQLVGLQGAFCARFAGNGTVRCWGSSVTAGTIPGKWSGSWSSLASGNAEAVCGIRSGTGDTECFGRVTTQPSFVAVMPRRSVRTAADARTAVSCLPGHFVSVAGVTTQLCSGPCAAGAYARNDSEFAYDNSACFAACPAGTYCLEASFAPTPCPAGTFGAQSGLATSGCTQECPAGFYCPAGSVAPTQYPCPAGRFGSGVGAVNSSCAGPCRAGWWCPAGSTTDHAVPCTDASLFCPPGSAAPRLVDAGHFARGTASPLTLYVDQQPCAAGLACDNGRVTVCPSGTFANVSASARCMDCTAGQYSVQPVAGLQGATTCITCGVGKYSPADKSTTCTQCSPGRYQPLQEQSACLACSPGTFSGLEALVCTNCSLGSFQPLGASIACVPCAPGSVATGRGATACASCAPGRFQEETGSGAACKPCANATYAALPGSSKCLPCTSTARRRSVVGKNGTTCETLSCPAGHQLDATTACVPCAAGRFAPEGNTGDCSICPVDSYTVRNGSAECLACPKGVAGIQCSQGFALAAPGYWLFVRNDSTVGVLPCAGGASVCSGQTYTTFDPQCGSNRKTDSVLCGACRDGYSEWNGHCADCTNSRTTGGMIFVLLVVAVVYTIGLHYLSQSAPSTMTIFFYYVQISLLMVGNTNWLAWLGPINFGVSRSSGPVCVASWDAYDRLYTNLFTPAALLGLLAGMAATQHALHRLCKHNPCCCYASKYTAPANKFAYARTAVSIVLLSYTNITTTTLQFLQCVDIDQGKHVVYTEPTMDCDSAQYKRALGLVVFILIADVLALPVLLSIFFLRSRSSIAQYFKRATHGELPTPLDPPAGGTSTTPSSATATDLQDIELDTTQADAGEAVQSRARSTTVMDKTYAWFSKSLAILYEPFHKRGFYWQVVLLVRRTVLVATFTFLFEHPNNKYMALSILNLVALIGHGAFNPYRHPEYNRIELIALLLLLIQSTIMTANPPPLNDGTASQVIVSLLIVIPIALFILSKIRGGLRPPRPPV